jgi:hypothetical protein
LFHNPDVALRIKHSDADFAGALAAGTGEGMTEAVIVAIALGIKYCHRSVQDANEAPPASDRRRSDA